MGQPKIKPSEQAGIYVAPDEWNQLISDPDVLVVDTRNSYETAIGKFRGATDPQTATFREFPAWAEALAERPATERPRKIAMYCTGGIRCEKSTALMKSIGFDEVYHLKGGILKYLEDTPEDDSYGRVNVLSSTAVYLLTIICRKGLISFVMPAKCR